MKTTRYRRWQVILGVIGFLLIMGVAGKSDQDSRQAVVDEKAHIRDQMRAQVEADEQQTIAYYERQAREIRP